MSKWKINNALIVLVLVALLSFVACEKSNISTDLNIDKNASNEKKVLAENQELRLLLTDDLPNLDPQLCSDIVALEILQDTLEGLIKLDEDGTVKKGSGIAKDWDISEDGKTYTFYLREANWSDGTSVTAKDFEYSWKRLLDPNNSSDYTYLAYDVLNAEEYSQGNITDFEKVGIKALDNNTLEVTLQAPNSAFISKLQHSAFLPVRKDLVKEYGERYGAEKELVPFCGPFMIEEWDFHSKLVLVKNPLYWDEESVKLNKITYLIVENSSSIMGMYKTDQIDYQKLPSQFIEQYKDKRKNYSNGTTYYYTFNTDNKYISSPKIRRAIRMSIDQSKVFETLAYGIRDSAYAFVPPGISGYDGKTFREIAGKRLFSDIGNGANKEEIEDLVQEGLVEQGMTLDDIQGKITYLTSESDSSLKYAKLYQEMIEKYSGIKIGIEQSTSTVRQKRCVSGDFTMVGRGWIADYNDAVTFMEILLSESSYNYGNFFNEEYDSYVNKAMENFNQKERVDYMVEAERILVDSMAIAPMSYNMENLVQKPYVKNIIRLPIQIYSGKKWAYILEH
ncbi:MAG: peptide ABC transporter substrate-binding protein [Firmicutes bacterium]|nr:peptide ABC transporter substrate-binding protein [Bacillota bacterium]